MNIPIESGEEAIDDIETMPELRRKVRLHLSTNDDVADVRGAILSTEFFFELDEPPVFERSRYVCRGWIKCKSSNSHDLLGRVCELFPAARFVTNNNLFLGRILKADVCSSCHLYRKRVMFYVRHPSDQVSIFAVLDRLHQRKISGFPHPMSWFVEQQGLNAHFGRHDHRTGQQTLQRGCCDSRTDESDQGRKRRIRCLDIDCARTKRRLDTVDK